MTILVEILHKEGPRIGNIAFTKVHTQLHAVTIVVGSVAQNTVCALRRWVVLLR